MSDYLVADHIYCYPNTTVLQNKLNIRDELALVEADKAITVRRLAQLKIQPIITDTFDMSYLCLIHQYIFQDLYDWAGQYRKVRISKGFMFAFPEHISDEGKVICNRLRSENYLQNMSRDMFIKRLAFYKSELNVLHPFRDGNGRVIRVFLEDLCSYNGYELDFGQVSKEAYIEAMIQSPFNLEPLEIILKACVTTTL